MGLLALVASLAFHLQERLAGVVAIETLTALLNDEIRGELSVGALPTLSFDRIEAKSVVVRDAEGREVIRVAALTARPDWGALWRGVIRIDQAHARGGEVTLYVAGPDEDTVSLAEAFQLARPSTGPPGNPPRVVVDGVVVDDVLVRGDVPEFEGLRVENVRLVGRVDAQREVRFSIWDGRGVMTGPYPGRTHIDRILGFFDTDLANEGLELYARARRGDDRVRARITLTRPDPEAAAVMELRAQAEPVRIETLAEMEIAPGLDALTGAVRGNARLVGPTDDLRLTANLTAESGRVWVEGHLPADGPLVIEAQTERLRLDQLVPAAPETTLAGRARISIEDPPEGSETTTRRVHAELDPLAIGDVAIPGFVMDGVLEDDALEVTSLEAAHAGGETTARGRVGFDGSLDVHVSARLPDIGRDPNVRRAAPGAHGALSLDLDVRAGAGAEDLRFDGRVGLRGFRYGTVRAERLILRGSGGGGLPAPRLDLEGDADGLAIGELALGRADVTVSGGPEGYEIRAETRDDEAGTALSLSGRARVRGETWHLSAPDVRVDLGDGPWQGNVELGFTPGRDVTVEPLLLSRAGQRIVAQGTYRFQGNDDVDLELMNVDLAHLRPLAPDALEGVEGRVDGRLEVRGDVDRRPQGRLTARIRDGSYGGVSGIGGRVDLELSGDTLSTDVALELGDAGSIIAEGPIRVPPAALRDPSRLIDEAVFEGVRVSADAFDVAPLLVLLGIQDDVAVSGRISTDAELSGTLRRPGVRDAILVLDRVQLDGWDPLRAKLHVSFGDDRLAVRNLWVADAAGALATAEADLPLPLDALPRDLSGFWRLARSEPWSLSVRVAQRRVDGWPEPLAQYVLPGLAASASITARNVDGRMTADVEGVARWVDAATDDRCAAQLRPLVSVRGRVEDDLATATITGFLGGDRAVLDAEAAAALPFDDWIQQGGVNEFPSTELVARVRGADMASVPWLCSYGRGPINGSLTAKDLLTGTSVVGAVIDLPRFQLWEVEGERADPQLSTDYRVHVRAGSTPERDALSACVILGASGDAGTPGAQCREVATPAEGELLARLRVPVEWTPGVLLPAYQDGGIITSVTDFEGVHVEPILALMPGIVSGDAVMDGTVSVRGPWEGIRLEGGLELSDGRVRIEGLGQHLSGIAGRLELRGTEVVFPEGRPLTARDAGGLASAYGTVGFRGLIPSTLALTVRADAFPIRNEGMVLAWLTGDASIDGEITDERTTSDIRTSNFTVRLPERSAATLQPLGAHPEILVVGAERPVRTDATESSYPIEIAINASAPFWVTRSDFSAQVSARLRATYRDPNLYVGGEARILGGTFEIFGKRFELGSDSTLTFNAASPDLNPRVNIAATYEVPGRRGVTVTVTVTGTLTEPELGFSSSDPDANEPAEVIALLISGGRRDTGGAQREASEQAASFLAGLTAGILTLGLRQEFGDVIPVLAVESEGLGGTRIRVGWNANDIIPDFLRDIVLGAYIEGFVIAAGEGAATTGSSGVGGGVSLEFTLPSGFLLRGTYVPVDNGSLDVLFEP